MDTYRYGSIGTNRTLDRQTYYRHIHPARHVVSDAIEPRRPSFEAPQTPVGPFVYVNADVTFSNGDAVLKGTLTTPKNCSRETPVLIMVTGSGLQNRDEEIFEHKPFAVIADAFAKAGIATLRYDDRGFGESTGDVIGASERASNGCRR